MDFFRFRTRKLKNGTMELYPGFTVGRSNDLMVRGGNFYAIWDEKKGLWSTDEYDVARLMDEELEAYAENNPSENGYIIKDMRSFDSKSWSMFQQFINQIGDNSHQLDQNLTFADTEVKKKDYVSRRLPYSMAPGDCSAWDELVGTLYSVEERAKIEWVIGAILSGDAKRIQKFLVLYGPAGTGKSTILNIIEKLFEGYTTTFEAKSLGGSNNQFATEVFKNSPLVAIQHDGDLSQIADNTKLNSIIAHEEMTMNEKFKSSYTARINAFLFIGTNQPVRISDSKSGIIRRLIDVHPTGVRIPINHYTTLMSRIDFELGAIAKHCLDVYLSMGKNYYNAYRPLEMMLQTDMFFNFIEAYYDVFKSQNGTSLAQAYVLYKEYCSDSNIDRILPRYKFREELRNYFDVFLDRKEVGGQILRSYYEGFNANKFKAPSKTDTFFSLVIEETESLLDDVLINMPAQYSKVDGTPRKYWDDSPRLIDGELTVPKPSQIVDTVLGEIDTTKEHFVQVPQDHIVIDFDLKGEDGEKSLERNLEAASVWPPTYAELSKGGAGVHLHYIYDGDVATLRPDYSEGIEVKTLLGNASLRRRLSKCNHIDIATISSGLPLKEKKVLDVKTIKTEKGLRDMIARNFQKEFVPGTKSSVDFIKKILDDAYESGIPYDVTDLKSKILSFAQGSTNQPLQALKTVQQMKFASEPDESEQTPEAVPKSVAKDDRLVFFDVEVYPNLFIVCWKYQGDANLVRMVNPTAKEIEELLQYKLVGFYNRQYDNHILYAAFMGYTIDQIYKLSQKIIAHNDHSALFGEAYGISYADIWDFSSKKQGLKKFEIELGIPHQELNLPWDQPVDEKDWKRVVDYCINDVLASEAVFEARKQDFIARMILSELSGLTVNDTTQKHTARIIFGKDRHPQARFKYTDLSKEFPGYYYEAGKSHYREETTGEGGYVYAEPGMYNNVTVLDIASMHPTTIGILNLFGDEYTANFMALKDARIAIKHKNYDVARKMLGGKMAPYLDNPADADALAYALKIVINIVYGLTSAKFDNPFRDIRNKDNIVAKRGALFMIDLKHAVQDLGFQVVHIKTDSIKIPEASPDIIEFVMNFGEKYGYTFEQEDTYDRFCLVNDAVYIAKKIISAKVNSDNKNAWKSQWEAVGAQFQEPYVFKTLFTGEPIVFDDLCVTKNVMKGGLYLDFDHDTPPPTPKEGMRFVGRTGLFVPVEEGEKGAVLYRLADDKAHAVQGTKGYLWMEADMAATQNAKVNMAYFEKLADDAVKTITKFGDFDSFVK